MNITYNSGNDGLDALLRPLHYNSAYDAEDAIAYLVFMDNIDIMIAEDLFKYGD